MEFVRKDLEGSGTRTVGVTHAVVPSIRRGPAADSSPRPLALSPPRPPAEKTKDFESRRRAASEFVRVLSQDLADLGYPQLLLSYCAVLLQVRTGRPLAGTWLASGGL